MFNTQYNIGVSAFTQFINKSFLGIRVPIQISKIDIHRFHLALYYFIFGYST